MFSFPMLAIIISVGFLLVLVIALTVITKLLKLMNKIHKK